MCNDKIQNNISIGSHIKKIKTFENSLKLFYSNGCFNIPCQIFIGSTRSWGRPKINESDNKNTLCYVNKNNIKLFVHASYLINFGRPSTECVNAIECLAYDLEISPQIGAKGVVVHVGKHLKMKKSVAIENMYNNIIDMIDYITDGCPLLIETPASQGTELLTTYEEFSNFYNRFTDEEKKKIKICIDTCHIFSAQSEFLPSEYINKWINEHPESLVLVHYNDSKGEQGCCKDRHAYPGTGHIGVNEMENVSIICNNNNIPMVIE